MSIGTILLIVLVLLFVGALPNLGYHSYGWPVPGALGVAVIVVLVLVLMGRL